MAHTTRLTVVDQQERPGFLQRFGRKKEAPDFISHELMKLRTVDSCVECIKTNFPSESDQFDIAEMIEKVLRNASRNLRDYQGGEE